MSHTTISRHHQQEMCTVSIHSIFINIPQRQRPGRKAIVVHEEAWSCFAWMMFRYRESWQQPTTLLLRFKLLLMVLICRARLFFCGLQEPVMKAPWRVQTWYNFYRPGREFGMNCWIIYFLQIYAFPHEIDGSWTKIKKSFKFQTPKKAKIFDDDLASSSHKMQDDLRPH